MLIAQSLRCYNLAVALIDAEAQIDDVHRIQIQPTFFAGVHLGNTKVVAYLMTKGADHVNSDPSGCIAKQIARADDDVEMLRTLDTQE